MLVESKNFEIYHEGFSNLLIFLYTKYDFTIELKIVLADFELSLQQAIRQVFHEKVVRAVGSIFAKLSYVKLRY